MCELDFTEDAILNQLFTLSSFLDGRASSDLFLNTSYRQAFEESPSNPKAFIPPHRAAFLHYSSPAEPGDSGGMGILLQQRAASPRQSTGHSQDGRRGVRRTPAPGDASLSCCSEARVPLLVPTERESGCRLKSPPDSDPC